MIKDAILVASVMFGCFAMGYILTPKIDDYLYCRNYRPASRGSGYKMNYRSYADGR